MYTEHSSNFYLMCFIAFENERTCALCIENSTTNAKQFPDVSREQKNSINTVFAALWVQLKNIQWTKHIYKVEIYGDFKLVKSSCLKKKVTNSKEKIIIYHICEKNKKKWSK